MCDPPELFAGVVGKGAEDAWYTTALQVEHKQLNDIPLSGAATAAAAADIFECFDQLLPELLSHVLTAAGMPRNIIGAYTRYITNLRYYNNLGTPIGKPHMRKCGGCSASDRTVRAGE